MTRETKRFREIAKLFDPVRKYSVKDAIEILKKCPPLRFDQSVEVSLQTGIDTRKSDQQVRGTVSLPNGTGKKMAVLVLARGEKLKEALDAGADYAGADELVEKIKNGWLEFDAIVATPDMMREVGKLGKVLGPRGLMPTPKAGTVTMDVAKAVAELKGGKIEFKVDKTGAIHCMVGKLSFPTESLEQNVDALLSAVNRNKPSSAKGRYLVSLSLSSTMGPGLSVDLAGMSEG